MKRKIAEYCGKYVGVMAIIVLTLAITAAGVGLLWIIFKLLGGLIA